MVRARQSKAKPAVVCGYNINTMAGTFVFYVDVGRLLFRYDGDSECIIYSQMFLFLLDGALLSAALYICIGWLVV